MRRCRLPLVSLLALAALPSFAGIYLGERKVTELQIDGASYGGPWYVSSPVLRSPKGYLAYDLSGKSTKVTFRSKRGPETAWGFTGWRPYEEYEGAGAGKYVRRQGVTLQVRAANGPLEGWYLDREGGELVLVKDRRAAATLRVVEKETEYRSK